ncbi:S-locus receptor kinase (SRK) [Zostera marina]|uniref:Receptor-like serine/threonine-protein kinase n=1 Tax=Zostera marina TaxID=29655 RepID=A0A0K9PY30_ZOSMR|nr:S-locus receptor kinase (SRK) [Zostera marina]
MLEYTCSKAPCSHRSSDEDSHRIFPDVCRLSRSNHKLQSSSRSISTCWAKDSISSGITIKDGDELVSPKKKFSLGFFSTPEGSKNRYLAIWYVDFPTLKIWVANRDVPIMDNSGVLSITSNGNLILTDDSNRTIWSTTVVNHNAKNPKAQILDSGNLIITDSDILWQSFDYPTDTMVPGVKLGFDSKRNLNWSLTSWKSDDDPSLGDDVYFMDHRGSKEIYIKTKNKITFRLGPWNGILFSGNPSMKIYDDLKFVYANEKTFGYYTFGYIGNEVLSRLVMHPNGVLERHGYSVKSKTWSSYWSGPKDNCDFYSLCGPNSICDMANPKFCTCLKGYQVIDPMKWQHRVFSKGCKRVVKMLCHSGEGFLSLKGVKLPDITNATIDYKSNNSIELCRSICMKNCSCTAYSTADASDNKQKGCLYWYGDLIDIKKFGFGGQELFLRLPASEIEKYQEKNKNTKGMIIAIIACASGTTLFLLGLLLVITIKWRRNKKEKENIGIMQPASLNFDNEQNPNWKDVHNIFKLSVIASATNNFSDDNKIGQGGFGSVYKGKMEDGVNIAVKRLFKVDGQGIHEKMFMNEAALIAKCQHKNLVRLLGCCIEGEERMLIFEFMQNGSLDAMIFGENRLKLEWKICEEIILGISKALLYLHQDSRFKIIHRDIKAGNVLLDEAMNPKITDFGTARLFGSDQIEDCTRIKIGTHGYMSPEYAMNGIFSPKSDVFSFGVLLLEIISGKKVLSSFCNLQESNLLELVRIVWRLYNEEKTSELINNCLIDTYSTPQALRFIEIGLLCVQEEAVDRPDMSIVVQMLNKENLTVPESNRPGFCERSGVHNKKKNPSTSKSIPCSTNMVTFTTKDAR